MSKSKKSVNKNTTTEKKDSTKESPKRKMEVANHSFSWIYAIVIFLFAFVLYANTLSNEYAVDDLITTTDNRLVQKGLAGIPDIFKHGYYYGNTKVDDGGYRPMSLAFMAIQTHYFGNNTTANHFFNIFFFAVSCVFLFLFLAEIFKKYSILIPFLITILYASHPIHTEVVANIKSLDEVFHFLFIITSLYLLLKYVSTNKIILLVISFVFYFAALLSKEYALTFIAIIPLILYFFTDLNWKRILVLTLPFIVLVVLYLVLRSLMLDTMTFKKELVMYQNTLIGAKTIWQRYATNFTIHGKYLSLLVFPYYLSWDYTYPQFPIVNFSDFKALFFTVIIIALGIYALIGLRKKNIFSFCILFYFITLSVASNFIVTLAATMGDRFIHTASLGFSIASVFLLVKVFKINMEYKIRNNLFLGLIGVIVTIYSIRTVVRNKDWKNNRTIYESGVITSPNSSGTHLSLAQQYSVDLLKETDQTRQRELYLKSIYEFQEGIRLFPENAEAYYNMGILYYKVGEKQKAFDAFSLAVKYIPDHARALNYLGIIYSEQKNYDKGMELFQSAIRSDPNLLYAYNNMIYIYHERKDSTNTIKMFRKMIEIENENPKHYAGLGGYYLEIKKYNEAIPLYQKALKLNPNNQDVYKALNTIYLKLGDTLQANIYKR